MYWVTVLAEGVEVSDTGYSDEATAMDAARRAARSGMDAEIIGPDKFPVCIKRYTSTPVASWY